MKAWLKLANYNESIVWSYPYLNVFLEWMWCLPREFFIFEIDPGKNVMQIYFLVLIVHAWWKSPELPKPTQVIYL